MITACTAAGSSGRPVVVMAWAVHAAVTRACTRPTGSDERNVTTSRRWLRARLARALVVVAVALAGLVAGLVVAHLLRPSDGEIQAAARELVPPGARLVDVGEIGGESFMDAPFQIRVGFVSEAQDHRPVVAAVEESASSRAWSPAGGDEAGNATIRSTSATRSQPRCRCCTIRDAVPEAWRASSTCSVTVTPSSAAR